MILYKYYPCNDFTFRALEARGLWCHSPRGMNDPFECLSQIDRKFAAEEIETFLLDIDEFENEHFDRLKNLDDVHFTAYFNKIRKKLIESWAFCALSRKFDDILMWSYYASGHTGIVLGFDFKRQKERTIFQPVSYKSELGKFDLNIYGDFMRGKKLLHKFVKDISIKADCWRREKEWRIWKHEQGYFKYTQNEVHSVYFGVNCTMETEFKVGELLRYVTHGNFQTFKMDFKDNPIRLSRRIH